MLHNEKPLIHTFIAENYSFFFGEIEKDLEIAIASYYYLLVKPVGYRMHAM